ncbi:Coronin-like protein crn1 [Microbotryomycetes sp. JL221]|nr:Coronin-like protein crn1 [Microbotryomycetes sp. JL221]
MSRFVRPSSYRHVYGQPAKKEKVHDNIKISASAWDTNLVSASAKYLAVNYQSSGGGAFLVTPLDVTGKLPDVFPLCRAHTAPVLDTAWSPFDDSLIASAGEDSKVAVTRIDESILRDALSGDSSDVQDLKPHVTLSGHGRKAGHVVWHPTADGLLLSASNELKLWDVEASKAAFTSAVHGDMVQSLSWDFCGTTIATTCKDKKLRLFDPRAGADAVTVADSHPGVKGSRVQWMGSLERIVTTGFSRTSERQVYVWDSKNITNGPVKTLTIDQSSGTLMPFWVDGNNVLFLAGKGDGNIRYYEWEGEELHYLNEFSSPQPQRGMCLLPPRARSTSTNEIARAFKAVGSMIEPISFYVPRKSEAFQADIFPPCPSDKPALSAQDWLNGKTSEPVRVNLETLEQQSAPAPSTHTPATPIKAASTPSPVAAINSIPSTPVSRSAAATPPPAATPAAPERSASIDSAQEPPSASPATVVSNGTAGDSEAVSKLEADLADSRQRQSRLERELQERDNEIKSLRQKLEKIRAALD